MTSSTMQPPTSTSKLVKEQLAASKRVMKKVLRSKKSAQAYLVRAGILEKGGKRLAKQYRAD